MKWFLYSICIVVAAVVAQAILFMVVAILKISTLSNYPYILKGAIFVVGFSIALFLAILVFKKLFGYLKEMLTK